MLALMDDPQFPSQAPPQWLIDLLEESEADVDAGRVSPWPEARARLMKLIEELDTKATPQQT